MSRITRAAAGATRRALAVTVRQAAALGGATALGAGVIAAAVLRQTDLALAILGLLGMVVLAGVVQVRRRMGQEIGALRVEVGRLAERLEHTQRQVVAAVEDERLAGADRHQEILRALAAAWPPAVTGDRAPSPRAGRDQA